MGLIGCFWITNRLLVGSFSSDEFLIGLEWIEAFFFRDRI
jgi:hypothetical protein